MLRYQNSNKVHKAYDMVETAIMLLCSGVLVVMGIGYFYSNLIDYDIMSHMIEDRTIGDMMFATVLVLLLLAVACHFASLLDRDYAKHIEDEVTSFTRNIKFVK